MFHRVQALILSPTRELASQTERVLLAIGDYLNIQVHACIGGKSIGEDIRRLDYGVHVVSGTPGRVCDMIKRRTLRTRAIKLLVLVASRSCFLAQPHLASIISSRYARLIPSIMQDEADEMLSRGFKDQIYDVYRYLPPELQVTLRPYALLANMSSNPWFMIIQSAIILPCLTLVIVPKAYLVSIFVISASPVVQIYTDYLLSSCYFITCLTF